MQKTILEEHLYTGAFFMHTKRQPIILTKKKSSGKNILLTWLSCLFFAGTCAAQNADIDLLKKVNRHETSFKNYFTDITATSVNYITVATPLAMLTTGLIKKDKKLQLEAAFFAGGYLINAGITHGLKNIIKRPRPFITYPFIVKREAETGFSFPSGHSSSAFYDAVTLSIMYPKWYVIAPSLLWAGSVGYARMYQGVHYPSDVLAGAVVGTGSAWLTYKAKQWVNKKRAARLKELPHVL